MYNTDNKLYPDSLEKLVEETGTGAYMKYIPECPNKKESITGKIFPPKTKPPGYEYTVSENHKNFTIWCLSDHRSTGLKAGYPRYTPEQGLILK